MRRLLLLPGAVVAMLTLLLAVPSGARADTDPYTPAVPTSCRVTVPSVEAGARIVLRVRVSASSTATPTGTVAVRVTQGDADWSDRVRYDGATVEVTGPRLVGTSGVARVSFTPDDAGDFAPCSDKVTFEVGGESEVAGVDALPDTGGPHLAFLLVGAGLLAAGGGLVERARRKA